MTKTIAELEADKRQAERNLEEARRRERDARRRAEMSAKERFEATQGVHVNVSDDYAGLTIGRFGPIYRDSPDESPLNFYFGYEQTVRGDGGEDEWCFVVKEGDEETMRIPRSDLHPGDMETVDLLLCGIGLWIKEQRAKA